MPEWGIGFCVATHVHCNFAVRGTSCSKRSVSVHVLQRGATHELDIARHYCSTAMPSEEAGVQNRLTGQGVLTSHLVTLCICSICSYALPHAIQ